MFYGLLFEINHDDDDDDDKSYVKIRLTVYPCLYYRELNCDTYHDPSQCSSET